MSNAAHLLLIVEILYNGRLNDKWRLLQDNLEKTGES